MKYHVPHLDFPHIQHERQAAPLVNHLNHGDWQAHSLRSRDGSVGRETGQHLPDLQLGEHAGHIRTLTSTRATVAEKLEAARQLIHDGVRSIKFKDEDGREHDYRIRLFKSGRVSVSEGDRVVVADGLVGGRAAITGGNVESVRRPIGRRPSGLSDTGGGHYRYTEPSGGRRIETGADVDHSRWNGVRNADGSVTIGFTGCQVDTDGRGAYRHPEDRTRQSHTSLRLSDGRSLDTDKDNFFVLPPSVARAYGIHKGDLGWLVQKGTGNAVPVVFGDSGPEGKLGEASVAALKALGYDVDGRRGVSGDKFEIVFAPGSGDGTGDIASNPHAMVAKLNKTGLVAMNGQVK